MLRTTDLLVILCIFAALTMAKAKSAPVQEDLPSFIQLCKRNDPELDQCINNTLNSLRARLATGIPELFIPAIEPLIIPVINLNQKEGAIFMNSSYTNMQLYGLTNFIVQDLHMDVEKLTLNLSLSLPLIKMQSAYKLKGKIMMLPLTGEGRCSANFSNVELNARLTGKPLVKQEGTYIKLENIDLDYTMNHAELLFENLFNGDTDLGQEMNMFINKNWELLADEIQPVMRETILHFIRVFCDKLFSAYSYDQLLPM